MHLPPSHAFFCLLKPSHAFACRLPQVRVRYYSSDVMKTASVDVQLGWATYVRAADEAAAAATPKKEEQLGEW